MGRLGDEAKTAYFGTYLPIQLGYFESLLSKNEGKGYFVGDDFTIVGSCCVVSMETSVFAVALLAAPRLPLYSTWCGLEQADAKVWSLFDSHTSLESTVLDNFPLLKGVRAVGHAVFPVLWSQHRHHCPHVVSLADMLPRLSPAAFYSRVAARDNIKAYLSSTRRPTRKSSVSSTRHGAGSSAILTLPFCSCPSFRLTTATPDCGR